jgi:hypothetical protein
MRGVVVAILGRKEWSDILHVFFNFYDDGPLERGMESLELHECQ